MGKLAPGPARTRRHKRVRLKVEGTTERPRLAVFRSLNHIYVQIIDDTKGITLVAAATVDPEIKAATDGKKKSALALFFTLLRKEDPQIWDPNLVPSV